MSSSNSSPLSTVFLGLGSNQGDRVAHLRAAVKALTEERRVTVIAVSPVYETEAHTRRPMEQQPDFLNAVVQVATPLSPDTLLRLVQEVEQAEGRRRDGSRWAPRPLDIDLLAYDDVRKTDDTLVLPHPRLAERRFVLRPWNDLAPNFIVPPPFDESVQALLDHCSDTSDVHSTDVSIDGSASAPSEP